MKSNGLGNIDDLFQSARNDGLTDDTMELVITNLNGPTMTATVGVGLDEIMTNEVTLAMNIIDMSGSMAPFADDLTKAYNDDYLAAMAGSSSADDILISTVLFNEGVTLYHGYLNLADALPLSKRRYQPAGTTALYDAVAAGLTNMVLYAQQLRSSGLMVRCLVIVYSDGEDNASQQTARSVQRAAHELMKHEIYTLAYVGFRSGGMDSGALRRLADQIGFPEILVSGLGHDELRRIFHMASMSTVRVSQQGASPAGIFP